MFRFFAFLLMITPFFASEQFVLNNESILPQKAVDKINEMTAELKAKTGVGVYLSVVKNLDANISLSAYHKAIEQNLTAPFVLVTMSAREGYERVECSADPQTLVDCDEALDDYMIPLFVDLSKDNAKTVKYSAGLLNGIAYICDSIAASKKIVLESSIGSESKNAYNALLTVITIMAALTVVGFIVARRRDKGAK